MIMLLHTDPATHRVSILSLPRDLVLYNVRRTTSTRSTRRGLGPSQLVALIEQDLGIPVNHFVELNFDTFQYVVNTLGGVKVYFPDGSRTPCRGSTSKLPAATCSTASRRSPWSGRGT